MVQTLAAGRGDEILDEALQLARLEPHFTGYLHATLRRCESKRRAPDLGELAALAVAARLGTPQLDRAVRRVVRRHGNRVDLTTVIAAALREPVRQQGSAGLLLAIWSDRSARQSLDDGRMAQTLFGGQPSAVFDEVVALLDEAHSVPDRVRCLLALGSSPDRQHLGPLFEWSTNGCRKETYAAAWALAQLPHDWLGSSGVRARNDRSAFVLRAALAHANLPAAAAWVDPLGLTADERTALRDATFEHFPRLAEWFRDGIRIGGGRGQSSAGDD